MFRSIGTALDHRQLIIERRCKIFYHNIHTDKGQKKSEYGSQHLNRCSCHGIKYLPAAGKPVKRIQYDARLCRDVYVFKVHLLYHPGKNLVTGINNYCENDLYVAYNSLEFLWCGYFQD